MQIAQGTVIFAYVFRRSVELIRSLTDQSDCHMALNILRYSNWFFRVAMFQIYYTFVMSSRLYDKPRTHRPE